MANQTEKIKGFSRLNKKFTISGEKTPKEFLSFFPVAYFFYKKMRIKCGQIVDTGNYE